MREVFLSEANNRNEVIPARQLLRVAGRSGSGQDCHLFEFVAGKLQLKFCFPETAIRH